MVGESDDQGDGLLWWGMLVWNIYGNLMKFVWGKYGWFCCHLGKTQIAPVLFPQHIRVSLRTDKMKAVPRPGSTGSLRELWKFDPLLTLWSLLSDAGPAARHDHVATYAPRSSESDGAEGQFSLALTGKPDSKSPTLLYPCLPK